jgi:hypothetical protein
MAFAIFYNRQDLTPIVAEATRPTLTGADRTLAQKLWNGGLKGWDQAPVYGGREAEGDPDCRVVIVSAQGVSKQDMIDLLYRLANQPGAEYMRAIANDMESTAIEPWPPA